MKLGTLVRITDINKADEEFKKVKEFGLPSCQLVYKPKEYKSEDALIIKEASEKHGIEISAMFAGYNDNDTVWDIYYGYKTAGINVEAYRKSRIDYIKSASDFAKEIGITDIIIHAGFVPNNPFADEYAVLICGLNTLTSYFRPKGQNLLLETGGEAPITLLRLIEDVGSDNLFINFDPANILMYGYGHPVDALKVFGKYVRNMHGKDGFLPTDTRRTGREAPVSEGAVDFKGIIEEFKKLSYDRYITIEREISGEAQIRDIIKAKEYFERLLSEAGICY